ncbi:MAG: undecaprenyl-phosphate glucose phosphotransferase [Burkholderiales bacterium]|nr:MAG: undecaprenyl-phosphate glucose phosphotransferase [Burkholderiales bacterium]
MFAPPIVRTGNRSLIDFAKSIVDPLLAVACLFLATLAWGHEIGSAEGILAALVFALIYPANIPFRQRSRGMIRYIAGSWALVVALLLMFGLAVDMIRVFDPNVLATWFIATPAAQTITHWLSPLIVPRLIAMRGEHVAIIVGANPLGRTMARQLSSDPFSQTRVTAFFDDREATRLGNVTEAPICGRIDKVADYVRANRTDQIFIALPMASQPRILQLLDSLRDTTVSIYFIPDIFMLDLIQARVDTMVGLPVVAVCESPFHGTTGVIKRLSDLCVSVAALVLTAPIMLLVALGIKLTMPGPVLFKQRRYGLDGQEIMIWKFRTMKVQEDGANIRQATRDDLRITPFGRFLRRTSLDELPQFFNVLQGQMSVVGPRPHAVAHNEMYRKLIKGYMIRHKVKPGITGLAQIHGARGETDTLEKMETRIRYDLDYLRNWSLRLDLWIIYRTVLEVFRDPNAY